MKREEVFKDEEISTVYKMMPDYRRIMSRLIHGAQILPTSSNSTSECSYSLTSVNSAVHGWKLRLIITCHGKEMPMCSDTESTNDVRQ